MSVVVIDPDRPLEEEFHRIASLHAGTIGAWLDDRDGDPSVALHEARKATKRLRALLRLVRAGAPDALKRMDASLSEASRAIAAPREASALVETVDRLAAAHPKKARKAGLDAIREVLAQRAAEATAADGLRDARGGSAATVREVAATLVATRFDQRLGERDVLVDGVERTLRKWHGALQRVRRRGDVDDFHDLRKAVKAHGSQLSLLRGFWPNGARKRRARVDALGDTLGELNDIHVMRAHLTRPDFLPAEIDRAAFDALLSRAGRKLSAKALRKADDLLGSAPRHLRRRFATGATVQPAEGVPSLAVH